PEARVGIRNQEMQSTRLTSSGPDGVAVFRQLAPGNYDVKVEYASFSAFLAEAQVQSGITTTVEVILQIRPSGQRISVRLPAKPVNVVNPQLQTALQADQIAALPIGTVRGPLSLGGGTILSLAATAPGVTAELPRSNVQNPGSFSANGNRGRANNITLDNATATDVITGGVMGLQTVPIDAVREFNLITTNPGAEFGRNSGSQVQILTKSGSNQFHGSLFEFFRNGALNARDYFDRTGASTPINSHDFGLTAGVPLRRDRVFFFGSYQKIITRGSGSTRVANVVSEDELTGVIDPTAALLLKKLQVPVTADGTKTNPSPQRADFYGASGRLDWNISQNDYFYARFGYADYVFRSAATTFSPNSNLPTRGSSNANTPVNATVSHTRILGPRTVNHFLASFARSVATLPPIYPLGGPSIEFNDGTSAFGWNPGIPNSRRQNTFQYADSLTYNAGAHQWKVGAEVNRTQSNSSTDINLRGVFRFATLQDFLNGEPLSFTQRFGNSYRGLRGWNPNFYVQDDYRFRPHLTFNLGLRLEYAGSITEVNNLISNLDLSSTGAIGEAGVGPLGAFAVGGATVAPSWNWGPRAGFAWNPRGGKFTLRGGYGILYDFLFLGLTANNLRALPPFMYQFDLTGTQISGNNSFANLVAGTSMFQRQSRSAVGSFPEDIRNFGSITPVDRGVRNPQVQQWSLTVQRTLPLQLLFRGSYVGVKGNYLQRQRPVNTIAPGLFTAPASSAEEQAMQSAGEFDRVSLLLNGVNSASGRLDPRFNAVTLTDSSANSNYHSAQFYLRRLISSGYGFTVAYTVSKSIDDVSDAQGGFPNDGAGQQNPFDNRNNRAVSAFDLPQRLVMTHTFESTQAFGIQNPLLRRIAKDWQFDGTFQAQSGVPITLLAGSRLGLADTSLLGGLGNVRPNADGVTRLQFTADPGAGDKNPNKVVGSGLSAPLVGSFGTLGRNTLRLNPFLQADWMVGRTFNLTETVRLRMQVQAYNVFNNTTFTNPGRVLASPSTFGYYADTDSDARNFQVVLRILW
ncbi:MAG: hypothetical protein ABI822_22545, partial [Bryobacteraceae bacterium]